MKWFHFILSHSIFIAFCAAAMAWQTMLLLQRDAGIFLYGFIFFATMCSYNFYWLLCKFVFSGPARIKPFLRKELPEILLMGATVAGLILCLYSSALPVSTVFPAAIFTVIYSLPLWPFSALRFVRNAGIIKTGLLAFTWTYVTAFMPLQRSLFQLSEREWFLISGRFFFMLLLCIIFDSRDIAVDKIRGLRSLATDLSATTLRYLVFLIFILLFATNCLFSPFGISRSQMIALLLTNLLLMAAYYFSTKKQGYFFYYFFIDGLMLFSALATYLAGI